MLRKTYAVAAILAAMCGSAQAQEAQKPSPPMKPALLVIDVQNAFLPYMQIPNRQVYVETINGAIGMFRGFGFPVIRVQHTSPGWGPEPGTEGFDFAKDIQVREDDPKIVKNHPSSFQKTELEKLLRDKGCNTVFLCGLSATGCVLATYYGAMERDLGVFMIKDGIASDKADATAAVEGFCNTVNFNVLETMLKGAARP
jgi:nicotinamidase-related amidase